MTKPWWKFTAERKEIQDNQWQGHSWLVAKIRHSVDIDDIADIFDTKPDIIVIGSGSSGLIKAMNG